ncbi:MAG: transposase [Pseudomonadota bacterium]
MQYLNGLVQMPWWGYVVFVLVATHFTTMAVTLFLHRAQAHRSLELHPVVSHACRFYLWLTTAIITKEWVAVHRKHHARCETEDDPHSPQVLGLGKVLLEGAELYQAEARTDDTLEKFGRGTPDDWVERNVYERFPNGGVALMFLIDVVLFGAIGITIWALQMMAMPVLSAGIINGLGHFVGYRNFECDDAATNLTPVGILCGGEELHNNHHAFPQSAKLSVRRWEFDIGWLYICVFRAIGLARVRTRVTEPEIAERAVEVNRETVRAIVQNRMHVLRDYTRMVTLPVLKLEAHKARTQSAERARELLRNARRALIRRPELLNSRQQEKLQQMLDTNAALRTVHEFRERLRQIWSNATLSNEALIARLKAWCREAEATGIRALQEFARRLQRYQMPAIA